MLLASLIWDKINWTDLLQYSSEPQNHRLELSMSLYAKIYFPDAVRHGGGAASDSLQTTLNLEQHVACPSSLHPWTKKSSCLRLHPFPHQQNPFMGCVVGL